MIATSPRVLRPAGHHPQTVVAGQVLRRAARSGATWGLIFGGYIAMQTLAYTSAYKTQAARDGLVHAYGTNVGLNALIGPAHAINTVAGYASWRLLGLLSILGAIWGLLTSTRLMRGDEEAGRSELLLAGQTTRRRAAGQQLAGLGGGLIALFALTAAGAVLTGHLSVVGFSWPQCLYFSVTLVASAATFLAIGAFTSQLAGTRRQAAAMAGAIFGVAYALRMVADSESARHWLVWLSPLGWIEESRPLTSPNPAALLPVLVLVAILIVATVRLAGLRDLGASTLPSRNTSRPHLALLNSPAGLAVRLSRATDLGWLFAVAAFSILIGSVAQGSTKDVTGSTGIQAALSRLGGHSSLVDAYLGLTFLVLALMIGLVAAGQVSAIKAEETDGRLENFAVRPVSRTSWLAWRLGISSGLLVTAALLAGAGTWAGAAGEHSGVRFGSLILAGLNVVPAALFLLGLGTLVFGLRPRRASTVVYGYLAWSFLVEFLGAVVHASHWLMDTSIFFHMVPAPAASPDWRSAAVIAGLGLTGAVAGGMLFRHRDVAGA